MRCKFQGNYPQKIFEDRSFTGNHKDGFIFLQIETLQNQEEIVILSSVKNLNILNIRCLQILYCVQDNKISSFAKVSVCSIQK